jgi:hypothetical protein
MYKMSSDTDALVNADLLELLRKDTTKQSPININNINIGTSNKVITTETGRYRIGCYSSNSHFKFSRPATMNKIPLY